MLHSEHIVESTDLALQNSTAALFKLDQADSRCGKQGLGAVIYTQLAENMANVNLHRLLCDV